MELKTNTIYGMTLRQKPTFTPGWQKLDGPVEFSVKVRIDNIESMENGDQYFTFVPVGFSSGYCGFGTQRLSMTKGMTELGIAPRPFDNHWYPRLGDTAFDLMC